MATAISALSMRISRSSISIPLPPVKKASTIHGHLIQMGFGRLMREKMARVYQVFLAQNHGALNNILRLPAVAACVMRFEFSAAGVSGRAVIRPKYTYRFG